MTNIEKAKIIGDSLRACRRFCDCIDCGYRGIDQCRDVIKNDTIILIENLVSENEMLKRYLEAAERDMRAMAENIECEFCIHNKDRHGDKCDRFDFDCGACDSTGCICATCGSGDDCHFKWNRNRSGINMLHIE